MSWTFSTDVSCSNCRSSTKVVTWVIFCSVMPCSGGRLSWAGAEPASTLASSDLSPHYQGVECLRSPQIPKLPHPIPGTAGLCCCSLWPNTMFVPNHQLRPGSLHVGDSSWACLDNRVPGPFLSLAHPSLLSDLDFGLLPSDRILIVRRGYFCVRSSSWMHWFHFEIHLYTSILLIKAFQKLSWNFTLNCLVSKILSEKLPSGHYQVCKEGEVACLSLCKNFYHQILSLCHTVLLCSFLSPCVMHFTSCQIDCWREKFFLVYFEKYPRAS